MTSLSTPIVAHQGQWLFSIFVCLWLLAFLPVQGQKSGEVKARTSPSNRDTLSTQITPSGGAIRKSPLREAIVRQLNDQLPLTIELFVMSQCPFGVQAEEALIPIVKEFGKQIDFQLHYIASSTGPNQFRSLHGPNEVAEDSRQLIIAKYYPAQWLDYILVRAKNYQTTDWQTAARQTGIDPAVLITLLERAEGSQLLASDLSHMTERAIRSSPTIFLNGQRYTGPIKAPANPVAISNTSKPMTINTTTGLSCTTSAQCDDSSDCTDDACVNNICTNTPITCDDHSACTTDSCSPLLGCLYAPIDPATCDDGSVCTDDACDDRLGCTNTPIICDDHNASTFDTCNSILGCVYAPIDCDDKDACTIDASDPINGCTHTPTTTAANAGPSQTIIYGTSATLAANTPSTGTGLWAVTSGPSNSVGQFTNRSNPMATFTPFGGPGQYVLAWTISNPPCTSSSSSMTITVKLANTPPVATPNANQTATVGLPFSYTVNAFIDVETPNSLTYTATIGPTNGLSFNAATRVISGVPAVASVSNVIITVRDPGGLTASTSFSITASNIITSIKTGNWEDRSTWNVNRVPTLADQVIIDQNHTVTLSSMGKAKILTERSNAKLKLAGMNPRLQLGL